MQSIPFRSVPLAFTDTGSGDLPVLLLHGFCEDSYVWKDTQPELQEREYRVIAMDLPGFGRSGTLPDVRIDDYADALETLVRHLDLPPFVLVGHSMGGYTGLNYLRRFPHRLLGFSLLHSNPWPDSEQRRQGRLQGVESIRRDGHALFAKGLIPRFFAPDFARNQSFIVDALIHRAAQSDPEGIIAALHAMMHRQDESDTLRHSRIPVQFILGKKDPLFAWEDQMAQTHLPALADIRILEQVGHMGMLEAPRYLCRYLDEFARFCSLPSGS